MKKGHRAGGKYAGSHTTVIPAAALLTDVASRLPEVTKISLGFVTSGLRSVGGLRRAKVTERGGNLLVSVRDNTSLQQVVIYSADLQATKRALYRGGLDCGIEVSFTEIRA